VCSNQVECLKFLVENGCPWNEWACYWAAYYNFLDCLKYLHESGCHWNEETCFTAFDHNNKECLKYLIDNECPGFEKYSNILKKSKVETY
jgi:hypothetical protein